MKRNFCLLICTLLAMHPAFAQSDSIAHKDSSLFFMLNANELSPLNNSINPEYLQNFSNLNFYLSSKQFNFNALEGGLLASYSLSSQRYTPLFNPMLCRSYFKEKVPEPLNFTLAANSPFTFLQYWQSGPADDVFQSLKLVHAQRFGKALLAGFQGSAINSKGFVDRQESKLYDFSIWSKLETKNYSLFVKAFALSSKNQENGGLSNDSAFIRKEYDMPRFDCDVNLTDAQTVLNGKSLFILNSFSLPADSLVSKNKIRLDFNYNQSSRLFTYGGSNLAYFNELGFDTIVNVDSTHFMNLDASLSYHFERLNPSFLKSGIVSFSHSAAWYYFNDSESENTGKIAAQVKLHPGSSSDIHVMAMYSPYGRTANDFSLSTKFLPGDSCSWALDFLVSSTTPDWFLIQYLDAYFNISAPGKENFIRLGLESSWLKRKLNTKLFIGSIENIAYFNLEDDYTVISDQSLFTEASLNFTWKPGILNWEMMSACSIQTKTESTTQVGCFIPK